MDLLSLKAKQLKYLGEFSFVVLGIFALVFFLERTIIFDAAFQGFSIIYKNDFAIQVNRFGAVFTQAFPLIGVKLGLPLRQVLLLYSLGFVVFPFLLYLVMARWLKNDKMGLVLILFYTLLVSHTFFWVQSELIQACTLTLFFYGLWMCFPKSPIWAAPLWYLGIFLTLMTHPLAFIPFLFIWLFIFLDKRFSKNVVFYSFTPIMLLSLILRNTIWANAYDSGTTALAKNILEQGLHFFSWPSTRRFFDNCLTDYYYFPILLVVIVIFYLRQRNFRKLTLLLISTVGYIYLVNGTFWWGGANFHLESFYQVLSIFLAIPLVFDVLSKQNYFKWMTFLLPLMVLIKLVQIPLLTKPFYSERIEINRALLQKASKVGGTKFLAYQEDVPADKLLEVWGTPCETLLLSALQSPDSTRTIVVVKPDNKAVLDNLEKQSHFMTAFGPIPYAEINKSPYFNLTDTTEYRVLNREEIFLSTW